MAIEIGTRFGRLTVSEFDGYRHFPSGQRVKVWRCTCDCGKTVKVQQWSLSAGHSSSCGCYQAQRRIESHTKHGHAKKGHETRLYRIWKSMVQRCSDPNSPNYRGYGAKGIQVEWRCFEDFLREMKDGYRDDLTIDRIDNAGNYCKENCRWATVKEQCLNRKTNVWIDYQGQRKTYTQWADELGIERSTVKLRLSKGWPLDKVFQKKSFSEKPIEFRGQSKSITQWAVEFGLPPKTLWKRLYDGWEMESALTTLKTGVSLA